MINRPILDDSAVTPGLGPGQTVHETLLRAGLKPGVVGLILGVPNPRPEGRGDFPANDIRPYPSQRFRGMTVLYFGPQGPICVLNCDF